MQKHWWSDELTELRNKSIEIHRLWQLEGKPRSGPTSNERLRVRAAYKKAIKSAQKSPKQASWNKLHGSLLSKSTTEFWKSWKQLYCKKQSDLHSVVNGVTSRKDIADSFHSTIAKSCLLTSPLFSSEKMSPGGIRTHDNSNNAYPGQRLYRLSYQGSWHLT